VDKTTRKQRRTRTLIFWFLRSYQNTKHTGIKRRKEKKPTSRTYNTAYKIKPKFHRQNNPSLLLATYQTAQKIKTLCPQIQKMKNLPTFRNLIILLPNNFQITKTSMKDITVCIQPKLGEELNARSIRLKKKNRVLRTVHKIFGILRGKKKDINPQIRIKFEVKLLLKIKIYLKKKKKLKVAMQ
jgi:hypothetical protein